MTQKSNFARITRTLRNRVSRVIANLFQPSPRLDASRTAPPSVPVGFVRRNAKPPSGKWVLDIVQAWMGTGRTLRIMTVADTSSVFWETACLRSDHQAFDVVCLLDRLCRRRGYPNTIRLHHEPEFQSRDLHRWACDKGIRLEFSSRGDRIAKASAERRLLVDPSDLEEAVASPPDGTFTRLEAVNSACARGLTPHAHLEILCVAGTKVPGANQPWIKDGIERFFSVLRDQLAGTSVDDGEGRS